VTRARRSGHTLVELAVVVALLSICAMVAIRGTAPIQQLNMGFRERSAAAQELLLAREYLRQDLAAAQSALPQPDGSLRVLREPAATVMLGNKAKKPDPGVDYRLDGERLVREDRLTQEIAVVAEGVGKFAVERIANRETRILLAAVEGDSAPDHSFTLVWTKS
jgi:prepilin-type N-terminal cleavage/methylation domain-containing protein